MTDITGGKPKPKRKSHKKRGGDYTLPDNSFNVEKFRADIEQSFSNMKKEMEIQQQQLEAFLQNQKLMQDRLAARLTEQQQQPATLNEEAEKSADESAAVPTQEGGKRKAKAKRKSKK